MQEGGVGVGNGRVSVEREEVESTALRLHSLQCPGLVYYTHV